MFGCIGVGRIISHFQLIFIVISTGQPIHANNTPSDLIIFVILFLKISESALEDIFEGENDNQVRTNYSPSIFCEFVFNLLII